MNYKNSLTVKIYKIQENLIIGFTSFFFLPCYLKLLKHHWFRLQKPYNKGIQKQPCQILGSYYHLVYGWTLVKATVVWIFFFLALTNDVSKKKIVKLVTTTNFFFVCCFVCKSATDYMLSEMIENFF